MKRRRIERESDEMNLLQSLKQKKTKFLNMLLLILAFFITLAAILTGSLIHDKEFIEVGMISPKRYVAPRDMVDESATEKLREAARSSVGPLYKHDSDIQNATIESINEFFKDVELVLSSATEVDGVTVYNKDAVLKIPVAFSEKQYNTYKALSEEGKENFKKDVISVTEFVFEQGITEDSMTKALVMVNDKMNQTKWSTELKNVGYLIISAVIEPNLVLDEDAMQAAKEQKAEEVQEIIIRQNQKIVDEGEVITSQIFEILTEMNLINQNYKDSAIPMIGCAVIVLLLFLAAVLFFLSLQKKLYVKPNEMMILFTVYIFTVLILRLTAEMTTFYLIPLSVFAMLISLLVSTRTAVVLNFFLCIIGTFIFNGNLYFLIYFSVIGTFSALLVQYTEQRKHIILVALGIGLIHALTFFATGLYVENGYNITLLWRTLYSAIVGILSIMVVIGSLPLWEALFEVDTPLRLLELTNPNNELMRRLMIEAPGTYHHCLIVANLAETAAYDIDANPTLARVGSYFHDIGKLKYPLYFGENQVGENPHDNMDPFDSASIIMEHVRYGRILADEAKLPKAVKNILREHHGTTFVKFFYYKASKLFPEKEIKVDDFRYPGPIPQSKEAAIVMLADTVEAAVRSTISNGKDLKQVEQLISTLIKDKFDDGQLKESDLKIGDLETIQKAFLKVFHGMYHDRIAYPKMENIKQSKQEEKEN